MKRIFCNSCEFRSPAAGMLTESELSELGESCAEVEFKAGEIIFKQDALSTNVAYIKQGMVKIHFKGSGRERIMKIVKAPAYLCLPSAFGDKVNHFSATAVEKTAVCFIDITTFRSVIYKNGRFAYQLILELSKGQIQNFHNCLNNAQKQNTGRVADTILFFAHEIYNSNAFTLPVSRQDIADLTGMNRESVSRILTDFHEDKIIGLNNRNLTILNESLLKQISEKG